MKRNIIFVFKKILPVWFVERVRSYRKSKRVFKRFSYNKGKPFFKKIEVEGVSFEIYIDPFLNSAVDEVIAETGKWEPKLSKYLRKYLSHGSIFVDIGANIGYHSLFAAKVLVNSGHVYSFEPQVPVCKQLLQSIEKNKLTNITVFTTALSDHVGEETLYVREENAGGSTLLYLPKMESFRVDSIMKVPLVTLDSYISIFPKVDVIKIDVEGYEYEVFKGAEKILEKYHPIIFMEFSPVFYTQDYSEKTEEFVSYLKDKGYNFSTMDGNQIDLTLWIKEEGNLYAQIDIICRIG